MDKIKSLFRIAFNHWFFDLLVVAMIPFVSLVATGVVSRDNYRPSFSYIMKDEYAKDYYVSDYHALEYVVDQDKTGKDEKYNSIEDDSYYRNYLTSNGVDFAPIYYLANQTNDLSYHFAWVGDGESLRRYRAPVKHGAYLPGEHPVEVVIPYKGPGKTSSLGSSLPLQYSYYDKQTHALQVVTFAEAVITGYCGQVQFLASTSSNPTFAINDPELFARFQSIMEDQNTIFSRMYGTAFENGTILTSNGGYTRRSSYLFQLPEEKQEEFESLFKEHQSTFEGRSPSYSIAGNANCQAIYSSHSDGTKFNADSGLYYLQFLLIAFSILVVGGRIALSAEGSRRLLAVYLLSGCSRKAVYGAKIGKGILDFLFALGLGLMWDYLFDYGYLALGDALYVNFEKGWFTGLLVALFYVLFGLCDYLALRNVSIAKDLRREF